MALLQQPVQRKLSALLGAEVTFEKLNLSLLSGAIEAVGVTVAGEDRATPLLTIARVRAEVAVKRALKGEIVVRSLTIERPVLRVVRRRDGTTNLPQRIRDDEAENAGVRQEPAAGQQTDKTSWKLDADKVLVIDGELDLRLDEVHIAAKPLLAELKRAGAGYAITLLIDSLNLRDEPSQPPLPVRANGTIEHAADLTALPKSPARLDVEIGDLARLTLATPSLSSREELRISFNGSFTVGRLLALLPRS